MKRLEKLKNAKRNIIWGFANRIVSIILPFINRTIMIHLLGDQYVGLNSLFTSILSVLNLAELGIGSALVYSMYEPIAKNDTKKICALMRFYRKCYRIIGIIVLGIGLCIIPILPQLINGGYPSYINIYILYFMYLGQTFITYNMFAYKNCLLDAHQRKDIASVVTMILNLFTMVSQMLVLLLYKNYYVYVAIGLVSSIVINLIVAIIADRMYPDYVCKGDLDEETRNDIKKRTKGLVTSKIGSVVINSADNIVISAFLGLAVVGWYNNYFYFITAVISFLDIILTSLTAGIGNSIVLNSVQENKTTFDKLTFTYQWIVSWCTVCFVCLFQPTMQIWNPNGMFPFYIVCLLSLRFYAGRIVQMTFTYKDALGLWWEDRWRPIVAATVNLLLNIILVNLIGISGVIISTVVCSIFINTPWGTIILYKQYLKNGLREHFKKLIYNYFITFVSCVITYFVCAQIPFSGFLLLTSRGLLCVCVPNVIFMLSYHSRWEYKEMMNIVKRIFLRKGRES